MIKSELIIAISRKKPHLNESDVELAVKSLINKMTESLGAGQRIEIRGFGSFSLGEFKQTTQKSHRILTNPLFYKV